MDNVVAYLLLTTLIALLQIPENYFAFIAKHKAQPIGLTFTVLEFLWVFVSIVFLIISEATALEASVAVFYIVINMVGWVLGHFLYKPAGVKPMDLSVIPDSFFIGAMFVCAMLFGFGCYVLFQSFPTRRDTPITEFLLSNIAIIVWVPTGFIILRSIFVTLGQRFLTRIDQEIIDAIQDNQTCSDFFGEVLSVELNTELTEDNEDESVYAFYVTGNKRSATLVAHFATVMRTKHKILFGTITTAHGDTIEINEVGLHA